MLANLGSGVLPNPSLPVHCAMHSVHEQYFDIVHDYFYSVGIYKYKLTSKPSRIVFIYITGSRKNQLAREQNIPVSKQSDVQSSPGLDWML